MVFDATKRDRGDDVVPGPGDRSQGGEAGDLRGFGIDGVEGGAALIDEGSNKVGGPASPARGSADHRDGTGMKDQVEGRRICHKGFVSDF